MCQFVLHAMFLYVTVYKFPFSLNVVFLTIEIDNILLSSQIKVSHNKLTEYFLNCKNSHLHLLLVCLFPHRSGGQRSKVAIF